MRNRTFSCDDLPGEVGQTGASASENLSIADLTAAIDRATDALLARQSPDGRWHYPLETDVATTAYYVLVARYLGETMETEVEGKIVAYLRSRQLIEGGWALYPGGTFNISSSVLAYFALKLLGDFAQAPHMQRACAAIQAHGGAERTSVFARFMLALFGIVPWKALPTMPVELLLAPRWFPFHLSRMASWARLVIVPLSVLSSQTPSSRHSSGIGLDELFGCSPTSLGLPKRAAHQQLFTYTCLCGLDRLLRVFDAAWPRRTKRRAIDAALAFVAERLNSSGLAGLYVSTALASLMYEALGFAADHPARLMATQAMRNMLVLDTEQAYCQPCQSPFWDTAWATHALLETQTSRGHAAAAQGARWLCARQVLEVRGDWAMQATDVLPGGWPFQYCNDYYPDVDDTAVVATAIYRASHLIGTDAGLEATRRACDWVVALQSRDGGWGAYDKDNTHQYLNNIPFADHGAMIDPPTADVTSRCLCLLAPFQQTAQNAAAVRRALDYLWVSQEEDGSWFGHWGVTYLYGTWSVLCALNAAGVSHQDWRMQRAVNWLLSAQNPDGGWGERPNSAESGALGAGRAPSTASQTAWAMLGLMAAGAVMHPALSRGIGYLMSTQREQGGWDESDFTGTGVQRLLYLRYHGYREYFPLWALARYRNLLRDNTVHVSSCL